MAQGHGASTRTAPWGCCRHSGCSHLLLWVPFHHGTPPCSPFVPAVPAHVSLALPGFLQGPAASLAGRCCPCPSVPVPRSCPGFKAVQIEALCPRSCLCPGASCRDSSNIPMWAPMDFIDPQPCSVLCRVPKPSPALPYPSQPPEQSSPRPCPVKPVTASWGSVPVSPAVPRGGFPGQHPLLLQHAAREMLSCPSRWPSRSWRPKCMSR